VIADHIVADAAPARDERLKAERLAALLAEGYRERVSNSTDWDLILLARRLESGASVIDHLRYFRQDDERIIVVHTYYDVDDLADRIRAIADGISARWGCKIGVTIGEHLNLYWPSWGRGFELRRHHLVRARGMHGRNGMVRRWT